METFGEWLRQRRDGLGLTRKELAGRIGCSVSTLRKIEDGERRPSGQVAELLVNCLDIPPEQRSTFMRVARGELNVDRLLPEAPLSPVPTLSLSKSNLPVFPTPLIGRERELEQVTQLLTDPQCRLLTLTGPGGVGKTRLAVETAARAGDTFANGAYFVPFAPINSARFVVPVIANAVGFSFHHASHADPKTQLFGYLREKQVLLVADNLEQLLTDPSMELLADLLECTPRVKLLATSRECLGLQDEWVFDVQGLPMPESLDAEGNAQDTSVELFLQRARRAHVAHIFTPQDYSSVLRVCKLVDGNPLAIELAAAWVRTLSCEEIAQEIEHGLDFLAVSAHDIPPRHRSMRAVFDHSWQLLAEEAQRVLLRLSSFRGGFSREAAEQIAGATLPGLSTLVTKSLVRRMGASRYDLHELIRQFAAEQLAQHPEEQAATQARHGRYYLELFSNATVRLQGSAHLDTLAEITSEMDNFRAAWDWAIAHGEFALIEETHRTFWMLYDARGWFLEGIDALAHAENALQVTHGSTPTERTERLALGHLLATHAWLEYRRAHYEQARPMLERSLEILRPMNEPRALIEPILHFGMLLEVTGSYIRALELYSEGLAISAAIGDRWFEAAFRTTVNGLIANTHIGGDPEAAHEALRSAVADWRVIGDPRYTAFGLRILSQSALGLGRYEEARAVLEESVALNSAVGDSWGLAASYRGLAIVEQALGRHEEAVAMFESSLASFTELGGNWWLARVRADMSRSVFALGDHAEARRIWSQSLRLAVEIRAAPIALEALASLATLRPDDPEYALELLLIVLNHPASLQETKNRADRLRAQLGSQFAPAQIEVIRARALGKTYEAVVEDLLRN